MLEERLRLIRIEKYGAGGEKPSQGQMQLFDLAPVVSEIIEQAENGHASASLDKEVRQASGWPRGWLVSIAVAASSCFPPVFKPLHPSLDPTQLKGGKDQSPSRDKCIREITFSD